MPKEAKNPDNLHRSLFHKATFHFYLLHCSACHASERKTRSVYLVDHSTGQPGLVLDGQGRPDHPTR